MTANITALLLNINIGALLLAALYHNILYLHRRDRLLKYYCVYLWVSFSYLAYRSFFSVTSGVINFWGISFSGDDCLQMLTFLVYIRFLSFALQINETDKNVIKGFSAAAPWVITIYIIWAFIDNNFFTSNFFWFPYIGIRVFLLVFGFIALVFSLEKRKSPYYRYLAAGASLIILFGLMSTLVRLIPPYLFLGLTPFAWLQFGYFFDVVLFSAAIGYRFKTEAIEREQALKTVMEQRTVLQQKELDKLEADYRVREEERSRISKDLHDDLGSSLSSIQLFVEVIEKVYDTNTARAKELLTSVKQNAQNASENMGDLVWALNTGKAFTSTFEERLKNYCYQLLSPKDISCFVEIPEWFNTTVTNPQVLRNLMMVSKECLNNIAKYSHASHCEVAAILTDNQLLLRISDDGIGFDVNTAIKGNGLKNIRQRVESVGGKILIESADGEGTTIGIVMPNSRL